MTTELLDRVARIAPATMFIHAIPGKLLDFNGTVAVASKGIRFPSPRFCWQQRSSC